MRPAKGTTGYLIRIGNDFMFRVYDKDNFTDYDIYHSDMEITINDTDAYFYKGITTFIDYSPQTLGLTE